MENVGNVGNDSKINVSSTDNNNYSRGGSNSSIETVGDVDKDAMGFNTRTPGLIDTPMGDGSIVSPGDVQG